MTPTDFLSFNDNKVSLIAWFDAFLLFCHWRSILMAMVWCFSGFLCVVGHVGFTIALDDTCPTDTTPARFCHIHISEGYGIFFVLNDQNRAIEIEFETARPG